MSLPKIKNAVDVIRESPLFTDSKYSWLKNLIEKVLSDDFYLKDISETADKIVPEKNIDILMPEIPQVKADVARKQIYPKKIKSIEIVKNVGLLTHEKAILFNDDLNIFYGQNGSGKSSLYLALCKTLGITNKKVIPNINSQDQSAECVINFVDMDNHDHQLTWKLGQDNEKLPAMIFDSAICNYIVEDPQENHFKLAHLKIEYFKFLQQRYVELEEELSRRLTFKKVSLNASETILKDKVPHLMSLPAIVKAEVLAINFDEEDEKCLKQLGDDFKLLDVDMNKAVLKNLQAVQVKIQSVTNLFSVVCANEEAKHAEKTCKHNKEYFDAVNKSIECYLANKDLLQSKSDVAKVFNPEWVKSELWLSFIEKSFQFIATLEKAEKEKYEKDNCIYCLQPLDTAEAKSLVTAYKELCKSHQEELQKDGQDVQRYKAEIHDCLSVFVSIDAVNQAINQEAGQVNDDEKLFAYDVSLVRDIFKVFSDSIAKYSAIFIDDASLASISSFVLAYIAVESKFDKKIKVLKDLILNADQKKTKLESEIKELLRKKAIAENLETIISYIDTKNLIDEIERKIKDLASVKKITSALETKFSNDSQLKEFGDKLKDEYQDLGFTPSDKWKMSSMTKGESNRRVYNLGNWRLSEIFSEGEKKVHALADFFAQAIITQFKGVYIFDDPVNSLDEVYIDAVARRIKKLAGAGNHVIVFTHNLVFLNCLVRQAKSKVNKLTRHQTSIFIEESKLDDPASMLKSRLKTIAERLKNFDENVKRGIVPSDDDLGQTYDLISGCLEDYVEKDILRGIITRYRPNIRMESLIELKQIDHSKLEKASNLYSKTSRFGTRHSQPEGSSKPSLEFLIRDHAEVLSVLN